MLKTAMKVLGATTVAGVMLTASYVTANSHDPSRLPGHILTQDDDGHTKKSILKTIEWRSKWYLKVVALLQKSQGTLCEECRGERHNQPVAGMTIGSGLHYDAGSGKFKDGRILDPENGKTYWLRVWYDEADHNKLNARGSLDQRNIIGRSQDWFVCDAACVAHWSAQAPP